MLGARAFLHAAHRRCAATMLIGVVVSGGGYLAWKVERQRAGLEGEVRWLRARLAEKRDQVARQRTEMAEVASAAERVVRTVSGLHDRATHARRLAHMEESRSPAPGFVPVLAVRDGTPVLVSEDAARALDLLSVVDGHVSAAADSVAVLTVLLKQEADGDRLNVPSLWPVRGLVTSRFGMRASPYDEDRREMHPGVDILARYGTPVTASGAGVVTFAGRDPGYGALVIVDHGGDTDTFYAHLSAIYVREGQRLRRGDPIGAVGASGRATGAHLHYEVRVRNRPIDPRRYLVN